MQDHRNYRRVMSRAALAAILAGCVAACAEQQNPAPVYMKSGAMAPAAPIPREPRRIVVQSGQGVNAIAHDYRVSPAAIIALNRLQPPYELKTGQRLLIPDIGPPHVVTASAPPHLPATPPPASQPAKLVAAAPPQSPPASSPALPPQTIFPQQSTAAPPGTSSPAGLPPKQAAVATPQPTPPAPNSALPPQTIFPQPASAAPAAPPQPVAQSKNQPDIIPLDGPAPAKATAASPKPAETAVASAAPAKPTPAESPPLKPAAAQPIAQPTAQPIAQLASPPAAATVGGAPPVLAPRNPAAALPLPGEEPAPTVSTASARFAWPVYGHILTTFGAAANGGRNDGINIAAPRGTPVHSIDSGTVAYVGNEVKGYGNLVLIKHENGFISAYAHLDGPSVKVGEKIRNGQVIGKVGETGGVKQPQLHFELRRGQKPVDPREFLPPTPSAGGAVGMPPG